MSTIIPCRDRDYLRVFSPDGAQILSVGYLRLSWLDQKEWLAGKPAYVNALRALWMTTQVVLALVWRVNPERSEEILCHTG